MGQENLLARYLLEKEGLQYFEEEDWFLTYKPYPQTKELYVSQLYLDPEKRGGKFRDYIWKRTQDIAYENCCELVICDVDVTHNNPEMSLKFLLNLGFKIEKLDKKFIYLFKQLDEEYKYGI